MGLLKFVKQVWYPVSVWSNSRFSITYTLLEEVEEKKQLLFFKPNIIAPPPCESISLRAKAKIRKWGCLQSDK